MNMAESEVFEPITIIWKDYSKILQTGIWNLFKEQHLVDINVIYEQKQEKVDEKEECLNVHKLILAVFFPGLKENLIQQHEEQEKKNSDITNKSLCDTLLQQNQQKTPEINLNLSSLDIKKDEKEEKKKILNILMEFAYSGTVTVPKHSLDTVLTAAEQLGFEGLVNCIREHNQQIEQEENYEHVIDSAQSETGSYITVSSDQSRIKITNLNLRKRRKGIPTKLRKPLRRQCLRRTSKNINSDGETVSNRSYKVLKEKELRKRNRTKRNACDVFDSDDDEMPKQDVDDDDDEMPKEDVDDNDDDDAESDEREQENNEDVDEESKSSKSEDDDEWKPSTAAKQSKISNISVIVNATKSSRKYARTYPCEQCDYQTNDKMTYFNHLAKHDPSMKVPGFTCEFCGKIFRSKKGYRCHMKTHGDPELQFKCDHCPFSTPQKWTWRQHLAVMHKVDESGNPLEDNFACDQCDFTCVALHQLKAHLLRKHTLDKPFKCEQCDYSTITRGELQNHVSVQHRNERRYMCEMCGFRSQTQNALTRHRRSHLGIKPFKCDVCGMSYSDRGKYKSHLQRHTSDEKPFVCRICGHACHRKDNLQLHMRRIHMAEINAENVTGVNEDNGTTEEILGN